MPTLDTREAQEEPVRKERGGGGHAHRWLMMACCVPMLVIVIVLVATGAVGAGAVLFALACVGMMAAMMIGMSRAGGHR
jgi:hypothetical protein